jgi:hypothetical protein
MTYGLLRLLFLLQRSKGNRGSPYYLGGLGLFNFLSLMSALWGSGQSPLNLPCTLLDMAMQLCISLSTSMYWQDVTTGP